MRAAEVAAHLAIVVGNAHAHLGALAQRQARLLALIDAACVTKAPPVIAVELEGDLHCGEVPVKERRRVGRRVLVLVVGLAAPVAVDGN